VLNAPFLVTRGDAGEVGAVNILHGRMDDAAQRLIQVWFCLRRAGEFTELPCWACLQAVAHY